MIEITLTGTPRTKLRPRFSKVKGKVRTYDSQSEEKQTDRWRLKAQMGERMSAWGPVVVDLEFVFKQPKSRRDYHTVKPDVDNLVKWILDVGNRILWHDDNQVVRLTASKRYGGEAFTRIRVESAV